MGPIFCERGCMTRKHIVVLALVFTTTLLAIVGAGAVIQSTTKGRTYSDVTIVPHRRVGLLLGCSRTLADGRPNLFFQNRIEAATNLFRCGKVEYLLVSGDNRKKGYDEASD